MKIAGLLPTLRLLQMDTQTNRLHHEDVKQVHRIVVHELRGQNVEKILPVIICL